MTPLQQFCNRWKDGCGSEYCTKAGRIVLYRGTVPCDVLYVAEAPGESEDALGRPMVGPAGKLMDRINAQALESHQFLAVAYCNLVGCIPKEDGEKAAAPSVESIEQCMPRLEEFVAPCNPRLIVCVGKLSTDWLQEDIKGNVSAIGIPRVSIIHPAAILRSNVTHQSLMVKRAMLNIREAVSKVFV